MARGEARYTLIANVAGTLATLAGVLLVRPATPVQAVLVWFGAQVFVSPYVLCANARVLGTSPLRPLRDGVAALAVGLLATAAAFAVPAAIGAPEAYVRLLAFRLAIVAAVCAPFALAGPPMGNGGTLARVGSHWRGLNAYLRLRLWPLRRFQRQPPDVGV